MEIALGILAIGSATFAMALMSLNIYIKVGGIGIWRRDINKPVKREVLTGAGVSILVSLFIGYITVEFIFSQYWAFILGILITTAIAVTFGIIDEIKGIKIWKKVPVMLIPSIPLVIFGLCNLLWTHTTILGIDFGVWYWIFAIPVVYTGFSNGANIIAGYDGLEGGIYILISLLYIVIGLLTGNLLVLMLSIPLLSAVSAFEIYNVPPSKIFLGNAGSFAIGGLLGLIPLIGHFEIVLPIVFLPHLIEFFFKIKYKGHTSVFGEVDEKGIIHNKDGIKSVLHWIISWGDMTEKKITLAMLGIESILCVIAFFAWYVYSMMG